MRFYLDHAATTPLRPEAREAWLAAGDVVGNASSTHGAGQDARRVLEESRERAAAALGCEPIEVIFTSGGTESINTALHGLWRSRSEGTDAVVLPEGEHHATMDTVAALAEDGAGVRPVPLEAAGRIPVARFALALGEGGAPAALATALAANNEVGTVNDSAGLAAAASDAGVPFHLDAVAAWGHVPLSFRSLRGDASPGSGLVAMTVAGHKLGAPVGIGALVVARTARLAPLLHGGAQQRGLRAGTQDVAGAAAFAVALELAEAERVAEAARLTGLRDRLISGIRTAVPQAELLGDPIDRLPGNAHILFPGAVGESLLFLLDMGGVAASTGSACQAGVAEPSHVVLALGRSEQDARSVLRFSLGRTSTDADVDAVLAVIADAYARASGHRAGLAAG
ncbi:cysteine desulfurase family protein [Microbacterium arabinogalactanolyticum]|uniref:cysteine desulfurase family protein n=1 Tax=Microbacterium arabinogalactanolyticum TaxID=69365 RepID=UPI004043D8FF